MFAYLLIAAVVAAPPKPVARKPFPIEDMPEDLAAQAKRIGAFHSQAKSKLKADIAKFKEEVRKTSSRSKVTFIRGELHQREDLLKKLEAGEIPTRVIGQETRFRSMRLGDFGWLDTGRLRVYQVLPPDRLFVAPVYRDGQGNPFLLEGYPTAGVASDRELLGAQLVEVIDTEHLSNDHTTFKLKWYDGDRLIKYGVITHRPDFSDLGMPAPSRQTRKRSLH